MKTNLFLIFLFIVLGVWSCKDHHMDYIESSLTSEKVEIENPILRSLNPTNFANDWENQKKIKITSRTDSVDLPWVPYCPTSIPMEVRTNIKKVEGWEFLSTPSQDLGTDYMIFYNRFTGLLKIFYYNSGSIQNNNAIWEFFDENKCGYFNQGLTYTDPMSTISEDVLQRVGVSCLSNNLTLGIDQGWNCFQISTTYSDRYGPINVYSRLLNISELKLMGNYTSTTAGTIIEDHSAAKANTIQQTGKSVIKVTGEAAGSWIKGEADKAIKNKTGIFKKIGGTLAGALSNILQNGVSGLVSSGLNALFSSFLGTSQNTTTTQTVELTTNGQINLTGTMTANQTGAILPLTYITRLNNFGAWNLRSTPKVTARVIHKMWKLKLNNPYGKMYVSEYYDICYIPSYEVVINPELAQEITYSVTHRFVEFVPSSVKINNAILLNKLYSPDEDGIYCYSNSDPDSEVSLSDSLNVFLNGGGDGVMCLAINSNRNIVNPAASNYINSYGGYTGAFFSYTAWIDDSVSEILDYFPKEKFPYFSNVIPHFGRALNVTVTMTVKATGQKIYSSRTFPISYDIQIK